MEMLNATIEGCWGFLLFGFLVLGIFASAMLALLTAGALLAAGWRWLARHTWHNAIALLERRALR